MSCAIELRDVSFRYPNAADWSLKHINLSIEKGRFVAVMGPNGAGKTTLSLCLNGLIPQLTEGEMTGQVLVNGMDTGKFRVQTLARHVGLMLQDPESQIFGRTVWEDVTFGPSNYVFPVSEIEAKGRMALHSVRLNGFDPRNTAELSGGEKQRLALAGIMALGPEILVLDEPAAELDPLGRQELYAMLDRLRREKDLTVIVIEHLPDEVLSGADNVIVLNNGQIVWQGVPGNLFADISLVNRFSLRPLKSRQPFLKDASDWIPLEEPGIQDKRNPIIEVNGLTYAYDEERPVLHGVDLKVFPGEFVALVGPNGSGKTTLVKHFNGLLKPLQGNVLVAGLNSNEHTVDEIAKTVGYLFQNPDHQIFAPSIEKEIAYGLKNAGIDNTGMSERISEALRFTGLAEVREAHPFSLGRGDRQLLAVASIIALGPPVLVIDEPTAGLDWTGVQKLMGIISQMHRQGTTIIMISHDLDLVAEYAQRVVAIRRGQVWRDGSVKELFSDPAILAEAGLVARANSSEKYPEEPSTLVDTEKNNNGQVEKHSAGYTSLWQGLDVRTKLIVFITMVVAASMFQNPVVNFVMMVGVAAISWHSGVRFKRISGVLGPLVPVFVLVLLVNAVSFLPDIRVGTLRGATFVLKILTIVLATAFFSANTPVDEVVQLLRQMRLPPSASFVITTALRFIPALDRRRIQILEAQKARGAKVEMKGITGLVLNYIPIMVPLLIYSIIVANSLAMAMLNRGFGYARDVTILREKSFLFKDFVVLGLTLMMLAGLIFAPSVLS